MAINSLTDLNSGSLVRTTAPCLKAAATTKAAAYDKEWFALMCAAEKTACSSAGKISIGSCRSSANVSCALVTSPLRSVM